MKKNLVVAYCESSGFSMKVLQECGYARKSFNMFFYQNLADAFVPKPFHSGTKNIFGIDMLSVFGAAQSKWKRLKFIFGVDTHRIHNNLLNENKRYERLLSYEVLMGKPENYLKRYIKLGSIPKKRITLKSGINKQARVELIKKTTRIKLKG